MRNYVVTAILAAGAGIGFSALAADADQPETIVVTASRTNMKLAEIGSSFTVIDRAQIEQRQSIFVTDLLRDVPGIAINRSGSFGTLSEVRVRGAEANHVLVMIDGIKANDPASSDGFRWEYLTTADIERIEIIRGPQSALWGSEAISGVVNIITRRPDGKKQGEGFAEGGSFSTLHGGARISNRGEKVEVDASASYLTTDGVNISRQGSEKDGYENLTGTLRLDYAPTRNAKLGFVGRYTDAKADGDSGFPLPADSADESNGKATYLKVSGDLTSFDERWTNSLWLGLTSTENEFFTEAFGPSATAADRTEIDFQSSWDFADGGEQTRLLTLAIDHEDVDYEQRGFGADQDQNRRTTGYVAEARGGFFSVLNLTGAIRHDTYSDFKDANTWRVTVAYDFESSGTRLRGAAGTGYKAPTFTEQFGFFPGSFVGNSNLKPESSDSWEIGIDQSFAEGRWLAQVTYFDDKLKDEIITTTTPVTCPDPTDFLNCFLTAINISGKSSREGVEFALNGALTSSLDGRLAYTYLDAEQPDGTGGFQPEARRPENTAALNLNWSFMQDRGNLNLNASYTGSRYDLGQKLSSYALVDLAASYSLTESVRLYGRVENLFDEDYEQIFGSNTPGIGAFIGVQVKSGR